MKNLLSVLVLLILFSQCNVPVPSAAEAISTPVDTRTRMTKIAFGSCNDQNRDQKIWVDVVKSRPDLWIWLGDNIYADTEDMDVMAQKYKKQNSHPEYLALLASCPIVGIWDDHDYGVNDGDKNYPQKSASKQLMLDFLHVPKGAPQRTEGRAAYASYTFGPKDQQVKVILLDARYFRDELEKDRSSDQLYLPNTEGDLLGESQWQWLATELSSSKAKVHIIGCGIQFIPDQHNYEKWANFPKARKRFFDLLADIQPAKPVLISGDRHIAEMSKYQPAGLPYPVYELTCSGLTHVWGTKRPETNKHRVKDLIIERNFGLINIDWSTDEPQVGVEVRGLDEAVYLIEKLEY